MILTEVSDIDNNHSNYDIASMLNDIIDKKISNLKDELGVINNIVYRYAAVVDAVSADNAIITVHLVSKSTSFKVKNPYRIELSVGNGVFIETNGGKDLTSAYVVSNLQIFN